MCKAPGPTLPVMCTHYPSRLSTRSGSTSPPTYPGQLRRYHWPFPDPAKAEGSEEEIWAQFQSVRDDIFRVFSAYGQGRLDSAKA